MNFKSVTTVRKPMKCSFQNWSQQVVYVLVNMFVYGKCEQKQRQRQPYHDAGEGLAVPCRLAQQEGGSRTLYIVDAVKFFPSKSLNFSFDNKLRIVR